MLDLPALGRPATFSLRDARIAAELSTEHLTRRGRERLAFGLTYLVAAFICLGALPAQRQMSLIAPAAAVLFGFSMLLNLRVGPTGWVACTQAAFVLLVFALPLNLVPLVVLALSAVTQFRGRPVASVLTAGCNCWYAIATVLPLSLLAPGAANWSHWPAYVATFGCSFAVSSLVSRLRSHVRGWDFSLADELAPLALDLCLTPIGLAAAVDLHSAPAAALALMTGATGLLALIDHEHGERRTQTERALRDPLTDLANRALFYEAGAACEARCARSGHQAALMVIDLDDFKAVNDSLGHIAGDEVLRGLAQALRELTRGSDTAARLGGDEFALILGEPIAREDAERIAQALRQRLARPLTLGDGTKLTIGASIGLSLFGHEVSLEEALMAADKALYADKRSRKAIR